MSGPGKEMMLWALSQDFWATPVSDKAVEGPFAGAESDIRDDIRDDDIRILGY